MINIIQNKIELAIYGYDKTEFMPITRDGQVENWREFVIYKIERIIKH